MILFLICVFVVLVCFPGLRREVDALLETVRSRKKTAKLIHLWTEDLPEWDAYMDMMILIAYAGGITIVDGQHVIKATVALHVIDGLFPKNPGFYQEMREVAQNAV